MTAAEFREAVVSAYRENVGLEPPDVRVTGDEQSGFTVHFTTAVWTRDALNAVVEFRRAAFVQYAGSAPTDLPPEGS